MTKQIKHLVAVGAISIITLGATVPANAQSINNKVACVKHKNSCVVEQIKKTVSCNIKDILLSENIYGGIVVIPGNLCTGETTKPEEEPSKPGDSNDNNVVVPDEKPSNPGDSNGDSTALPDEKPSKPGESNDDNVVVPDEKPSNPGDSNDNNTVVPDEKPDQIPGTSNDFNAFQQKVLEIVNVERAKVGAKALTLNSKLSNVATAKSQDMINKNYFDHNSPTYGSPFDMMKQFGISYKTAGENIAMGQTSPEEVMNSWMNSSGHRKNILNPSFTEIGVGIAKNSKGQLYWTQMFIGN